jgi:hypothetical protein
MLGSEAKAAVSEADRAKVRKGADESGSVRRSSAAHPAECAAATDDGATIGRPDRGQLARRKGSF